MKYQKIISTLILLLILVAPIYAFWETTDQGPSSPVNTIIVVNGKLFAASHTGGVWLSQNQGDTWLQLNKGLATNAVYDIKIGKSLFFAATDGSGIFKSLYNNGFNWVSAVDGTSFGNRNVFALATSNDTVVAITDEYGVFFSSDAGTSWFGLNNADINSPLISVAINNGTVYVGTLDNLWSTSNMGTDWFALGKNNFAGGVRKITFKDNKIIVGTGQNGILISSDGGQNWAQINNGLSDLHVNDIEINGNNMYVGTNVGGVFFSTDEGKSWVAENDSLPDLQILTLAYDTKYLYAGTNGASSVRRLLSEIKYPVVVPPELHTPTKDAINLDTNTSVSWGPSVGAISYHVQVAYDSIFTTQSTYIDQNNLVAVSSLPVSLQSSTTYYWRVGANTSDGQVKWSVIWSFSTRTPFFPVSLVSPADKSKDLAQPVILTWSAGPGQGPLNYIVEVDTSTASPFTSAPINVNNLLDTTYTLPVLDTGKTYYWRIGDYNGVEVPKWSVVYSFTTSSKAVSVEESNLSTPLNLAFYPNPSNGNITISYSSPAPSQISIKLYDCIGRTVAEIQNAYQASGAYSLSYNLNDVIPGVYRLSLTAANKTISRQLVVIK